MKYCIIIILLICSSSLAQTPKKTTLKFKTKLSKSWGELSNEKVTAVAEDSKGNIFIVGDFNGYFPFLKETGKDAGFTSLGDNDIFLFKLSKTGEILLSIHLGSSSYDLVSDIAIDHRDNVYLGGYFRETIDLFPGEKTDFHKANGHSDAFLLKLDNNGKYLWAKSWGGKKYDIVESIAIDKQNNVCIAGTFSNTIQLSNDSKFTLTSKGRNDIYYSKLTPDGKEIWSKSFGSTHQDYTTQMVLGPESEILITGYFKKEINLASGKTFKSGGLDDGFLAKVDPLSGNIVNFGILGGASQDFIEAVDTDSEGNVYLTGYFLSDCDVAVLTEETHVLKNDSNHNSFVVKLNKDFQFVWVKEIKGKEHKRATHMLVLNDDIVIVGGEFRGLIESDREDKVLSSEGGDTDIFLLFLDKNGVVGDFRSIGGQGREELSVITPIGTKFIIGGKFEANLNSIEKSEIHDLSSNGGYDSFIQKISVKN